MDVRITADVERRLEREAARNLQMRLAHVRCPDHGTRVDVTGVARPGQVLPEPCCEKMRAAIQAALR